MMDIKEYIAARVARELKDGDVVNLGIGLPQLVVNYTPDDISVILHAENGFIGLGCTAPAGKEDPYIVDAGGSAVTIEKYGAFFDSALSFTIIRGGHLDITVLGALEVDEKGNLSNWIIPGKFVPGMGGAMDLVVGAKKVIIAMEHTSKGRKKILKECTLPKTGVSVVDMIITEMGVMNITPNGIELSEYNPEFTIEQIQDATEAGLIISKNLKTMG